MGVSNGGARPVLVTLVLTIAVWCAIFFPLTYPEIQENQVSSGSTCTVIDSSLTQSWACNPLCSSDTDLAATYCSVVNGTSPTLCSALIASEAAKDASACSYQPSQCAAANSTCCTAIVTPTNITAGSFCDVSCDIWYTTSLRVQYEIGTISVRTHQAWLTYNYQTNLEAALARKSSFPVNLVQDCWYDSDNLNAVSFDEPTWTWWKWVLLALPSCLIIVLLIVLTTQKFAKSTRCANPHLPAAAIWLGVILPIVILVPILTGNITQSSRAALICAITSFVSVGLCALTLPCVQSCNQCLPCAPGLIVCCCLIIPVGVFLPLALIGNISDDTRTLLYIIAPSLTVFPILFGLFYVCYESSQRRKLYGKGPVRLPDGDECSPECWGDTILCPCFFVSRCCQSFWNPEPPLLKNGASSSSSPVKGRAGRRISPIPIDGNNTSSGAQQAWPISSPTAQGVGSAGPSPMAALTSPSAAATTGLSGVDTSRRDTVMGPVSPLQTERGKIEESTMSTNIPGSPMQQGIALQPMVAPTSNNLSLRRLTLHPGLPGHSMTQPSPLGPRSLSFAAPSGVGFPGVPALNMPPPSPTLTFHYPQGQVPVGGLTPMHGPISSRLAPGIEHSPIHQQALAAGLVPVGHVGAGVTLPLPPLSSRGTQHFSFGHNGSPRLSVPSLSLTPAQQAALAAHAHGPLPAAHGAMTTPHRGHAGQSFSFAPEHLHPATARGSPKPPGAIDMPVLDHNAPPNYEGHPQQPGSAGGHRSSRIGHHLQPSWHGDAGNTSPSLSTGSSNASLAGVAFHSARHHSIGNADMLHALRGRSHSIDHGSARGSANNANQAAIDLHAELVRINETAEEERAAAIRRASVSSGTHQRVGSGVIVVAHDGKGKGLAKYASGSEAGAAVPPPAYQSGSNSRRNSESRLDIDAVDTKPVAEKKGASSRTQPSPPAPIIADAELTENTESPQGTPLFSPDEHAVRPTGFSSRATASSSAATTTAAKPAINIGTPATPTDIRSLTAAHNAAAALEAAEQAANARAATAAAAALQAKIATTSSPSSTTTTDSKDSKDAKVTTTSVAQTKNQKLMHDAQQAASSIASTASLVSTAATALAAVAGVATATTIAVPATAVAAGAATVATVAGGVDKILAQAEKMQKERAEKKAAAAKKAQLEKDQKTKAIDLREKAGDEAAAIGAAHLAGAMNVAATKANESDDFVVDTAALQESKAVSVTGSGAPFGGAAVMTPAVMTAVPVPSSRNPGSRRGSVVSAGSQQPPMVTRSGYGGLSINVGRSVDLSTSSPLLPDNSPNRLQLQPSNSGGAMTPPGPATPEGPGASLINRRLAAANAAAAAVAVPSSSPTSAGGLAGVSRLPPLTSAQGSMSQLQPKALKPLAQPGSPAGSNTRPRSQSSARRMDSSRALTPQQQAGLYLQQNQPMTPATPATPQAPCDDETAAVAQQQ